MIVADDMMTFIKNDIIVFGFGVFKVYSFNIMVNFQKLQMGFGAIEGCASSVILMVGLLGI